MIEGLLCKQYCWVIVYLAIDIFVTRSKGGKPAMIG